MRAEVIFGLMVAAGALAVTLAVLQSPNHPAGAEQREPALSLISGSADSTPLAAGRDGTSGSRALASSPSDGATLLTGPGQSPTTTNKLERLNQIRDSFRALAQGDASAALQAAKDLSDETERETALLTLVLEWTQGEIRSPRDRARASDAYGFEAGLGIELAKRPDLALLWANQLTEGPGRSAIFQRTAVELLDSDPSAAFALSEQLLPEERGDFFHSLFAGWAEKDTTAAMDWAQQLDDPAQRDAALQAIRSVAPVGIGAVLSMQEGYATINQLLAGSPAELGGQVRPGDRILALAQGDSAFVNAKDLALSDVVQMIRGAPGTTLQLQVLSADAPADSPPRTISIIRDQIRFKH